jgi:hypothetical protein
MAEPKKKLLTNFTQDHQTLLHKYLNFFSQKKVALHEGSRNRVRAGARKTVSAC